jgi:hypothetical protein
MYSSSSSSAAVAAGRPDCWRRKDVLLVSPPNLNTGQLIWDLNA